MLRVSHVTKKFGELVAVNDLSFHVPGGQIYGIAGPNGAGKSTIYNLITGYYDFEGEILFDGTDIAGLPSLGSPGWGFRAPSEYRGNLTASPRRRVSAWAAISATARPTTRKQVDEIIAFVDLEADRGRMAGELNLLGKKKVMISAALTRGRRCCFLDEPMAGSNAHEIRDLMELIRKINEEMGIVIVIIEHFMKVLTELTTTLLIIDAGTRIAGDPAEVIRDPRVIECYLGEEYAENSSLNAYYGQFHVLHDVSCEVREGEVVVMLGPNGHGKSTLLKAVCSLLDRVDGAITYRTGTSPAGPPSSWSTRVIYIAETRELFGDMTVLENLRLGAYARNARRMSSTWPGCSSCSRACRSASSSPPP